MPQKKRTLADAPPLPEKDEERVDPNPDPILETPTTFWERFAIFNRTIEEKAEITEIIIDELQAKRLYWMLLLLSTVIATFGLLQNSVAVIIGAMLIAPLLRPIQGIAFGITTGQPTYLLRGLKIQFWSVLITITFAYLFAFLIPLRLETTEILARTSPNLLDLLIAIASAIIAILALSHEKLSSSVAGVAMSASLLPPLCVVGIELSLANHGAAWGSFFLYLTNLFAILSVGVIMFLFYGFSPHQSDNQTRTLRSVLLLVVLGVFISLPLFSSLTEIAEKIKLQSKASNILQTSLLETIPGSKVEQLQLLDFDKNRAEFLGTIKVPEEEQFFSETQEDIRRKLGKALKKEVSLEIDVINVASIISEQEQLAANQLPPPPLDQQISNKTQEYLKQTLPQAIILDLQVSEILRKIEEDEEELQTEQQWGVKIAFSLPAGEQFDEETQQGLEKDMKTLFPNEELNFFWVFLSADAAKRPKKEKELTDQEKLLQELTLQWESFLSQIVPKTAEVKELQITWRKAENPLKIIFGTAEVEKYRVSFDLYMPAGEERNTAALHRELKRFAQKVHGKPTDIRIRTFPFQEDTFSAN